MSDDAALAEARDAALQRIGRNLVNFQKMEAMLKFILTNAGYSKPVSELAAHFSQEEVRWRAKTMGELVERAAKVLHTSPEEHPSDIKEMWVSSGFTFEGIGALSEWRKEMRRIVKERNQLVHHLVGKFDPRSIESCGSLSADLDLQRERVIGAYNHLESIVKAILDRNRYLAEHVDEIVAALAGPPSHDA